MREMRFRAWDGVKMYLLHLDDWTFFNGEICHRNASLHKVMQYTGLNDKNGKEIYEGDILCLDYTKNKWVIKYFGCGFRGEPLDENELLKGYYLTNNNYLQFEVIGNIHENPELL